MKKLLILILLPCLCFGYDNYTAPSQHKQQGTTFLYCKQKHIQDENGTAVVATMCYATNGKWYQQ